MRDLVTHLETGIVLDLSADDYGHPRGREIVRSLHGHMSRSDPKLVCAKHNAPLYLQARHHQMFGSRLWGIHFDSKYDSHMSAAMSDEHKRQTEYVVRAAEDAGFRAGTEVSLPTRVRPDAVVYGPRDVGIEIQRSHLTRPAAVGRTRKAVNAGLATSVWFSDRDPSKPPRWFWYVPSIGMNVLPWDVVPPKGSATVATGLRTIRPLRCTFGNVGNCPETGGRPCGRVHPKDEPLGGMTVDDIAASVPAGEIVPLRYIDDRVLLVPENSKTTYEELIGRPAEMWMSPITADTLTATPAGVDGRVECTADPAEEFMLNPTVEEVGRTSAIPLSWAARNLGHWPGRCKLCGWHIAKQGHHPTCGTWLH